MIPLKKKAQIMHYYRYGCYSAITDLANTRTAIRAVVT